MSFAHRFSLSFLLRCQSVLQNSMKNIKQSGTSHFTQSAISKIGKKKRYKNDYFQADKRIG